MYNYKFCFYYVIITFILLLLCKPSFIKDNKKIGLSYSKLLLWELVVCLPLILYYIINH